MIINPRLIDYFDLEFNQDSVDFAIPHLKEDIPLYIDPFLLWSSHNAEYKKAHQDLVNFFDYIRILTLAGRETEALKYLLTCEEPREFGLGYALGSKRGSTIGPQLANNIIILYKNVPQLGEKNLNHIEEIQLLVPKIAEDRISDLASFILKEFFIKYTIEQSIKYNIPTKLFNISNVYDHDRKCWQSRLKVNLPYNPYDGSPLIFVPLDMLRHLPWINYEDYYRSFYAPFVLPPNYASRKLTKEHVIAYNKINYITIERYVQEKEKIGYQCRPDPLFVPLQVETLKRKINILRTIPTGMEDNNDKKYEEIASDLLSSLLYPELEFAASQVRTVSGAHIRDLIFYNDGKIEFLRDMRERFEARQVVFEFKNVKNLESEHVNQLFRYLDEEFGHFGILATRNPAPRAIQKNTVDLHSSKRYVILCLDDSDFELMLNLLESNRSPIEAIKKKFIEFTRLLPK